MGYCKSEKADMWISLGLDTRVFAVGGLVYEGVGRIPRGFDDALILQISSPWSGWCVCDGGAREPLSFVFVLRRSLLCLHVLSDCCY
jgi:hypothetical protein